MNSILANIILVIGLFQVGTETPTPTLTPTPTGAPYCEVDISGTPTPPFGGEFQYIEFNTPTPGASATWNPLTSTPTPAVSSTPTPTATKQPNHAFVGNNWNPSINHTSSSYWAYSDSPVFNMPEAYQIGTGVIWNRVSGCEIGLSKQTQNHNDPDYLDLGALSITSGSITTQCFISSTGMTNSGAYSAGLTENSICQSLMGINKTSDPYNTWKAPNANSRSYFYAGWSGCVGTISANVWPIYFGKDNRIFPTATPQNTPTITPTYCKIPEDMAATDPIAIFENEYTGQVCYTMMNPITLAFTQLPAWITEVIDDVGIALQDVSYPGLEICLEKYSANIQLMDVDLMPFITAMIALVTLGLLISEIRS